MALLLTDTRSAILVLGAALLLLALLQRRVVLVAVAVAVVAVAAGWHTSTRTSPRGPLDEPQTSSVSTPRPGGPERWQQHGSSLLRRGGLLVQPLAQPEGRCPHGARPPQGFGLGNAGSTAARNDVPLKAGESNYTELGVELGVLGALLWIAWGVALALVGVAAARRRRRGVARPRGRRGARGHARSGAPDRRDRRPVDRVRALGTRGPGGVRARYRPVMRIDPRVDIGHVHLKVADIDRALAFYCDVLGFELQQRMGDSAAFVSAGGYHHHIGLNTWESRGGGPPPRGTTGLYHVAIRYPDRATLGDALRRLVQAGFPLEGASDHGVSEALYLRDPDGNGIELYRDRPREEWPRTEDGDGVVMDTRPLDVEALLREASG